jgi:hypothetical protein
MKTKILEKFDEIFSDLNNLSPEKLETLVHESLKFFDDLKVALDSPNEEEKKEALKIAQQLQKKLEEQAEKAYKASGMTKEQISAFMENPANFSQEEWAAFQSAKTELFDFQKDILKGAYKKIEDEGSKEKAHAKKTTPVKGDKKFHIKG